MKIRHSGISVSASISFFFASLISICFLLINVSSAQSEVTVRPIEEADLDELINQEDGALIVSFMAAWCGPASTNCRP
jgi:high-affinity nickel permease